MTAPRFRASRDPALTNFLAELDDPPWDAANARHLAELIARDLKLTGR